MIRQDNYSAKKKHLILFCILLGLTSSWIFFSIDIRRFVINEIENFQTTFTSFSSIHQLNDDGLRPKKNGVLISFAAIPKIITDKLTDTLLREDNNGDGKIKLFIKFKHLEKIYSDRERALQYGVNKDPTEVPCKISDGQKTFKCKVRLKGDLIGHWESKKRMSLRIKIKDGYIYGLKDFSIQKPSERQFPYDQIFHQSNSNLGQLSSNNQGFFNISVNNDSWGLMNIEPTIDERFVEKNGLKRVGVFRISNQDDWFHNANPGAYQEYFVSDPTINLTVRGNEESFLKNEINMEIYSHIHKMLTNKNGKIFNREKMIGNLILGLVWGNLHALYNANSWYMWNAYEHKLEPILSDQGEWGDIKSYLETNKIPFEYKILLQHSQLTVDEFNKELNKISDYFQKNSPIDMANDLKKKYFKNDSLFYHSNIYQNIEMLSQDPEYYVDQINNLVAENKYKNPKKDLTESQIKLIPDYIKIFHYLDGQVKIYNLLDKDINIKSLLSGSYKIYINQKIPASKRESLNYIVVPTTLTGDHSYNIEVVSSYKKIEKKSVNDISLMNNEISTPTKKYFSLNNCQFFASDDVCVLSGNLKFKQTQYFDIKTIVLPNTEIFLDKDVDIIFEHVDMRGEKDQPIKITGNQSGGVIIFNKENQSSKLSHVKFSNLNTTSASLMKYTGAINGYGGSFEIESVDISNSEAEDQLNLVNAKVKIKNLAISGGPSDALDCDFCHGELEEITIKDMGGDGLDFSGSDLKIKSYYASKIKDKALSVGEQSNVYIDNGHFKDVATGIAVKDGSKTFASNIHLENITYDHFMTYVKKPFFSNETILEVNDYFLDTKPQNVSCIRESNTALILNNQNCYISEVNIDELYQGRMKK